MADDKELAKALVASIREVMEKVAPLERMMTPGVYADQITGMRPLPKKVPPPRVPPPITAGIYRRMIRGTS